MASFTSVTPSALAFDRCTACSAAVVATYESEGVDFVEKACRSPQILEEVSGLEELRRCGIVRASWYTRRPRRRASSFGPRKRFNKSVRPRGKGTNRVARSLRFIITIGCGSARSLEALYIPSQYSPPPTGRNTATSDDDAGPTDLVDSPLLPCFERCCYGPTRVLSAFQPRVSSAE